MDLLNWALEWKYTYKVNWTWAFVAGCPDWYFVFRLETRNTKQKEHMEFYVFQIYFLVFWEIIIKNSILF